MYIGSIVVMAELIPHTPGVAEADHIEVVGPHPQDDFVGVGTQRDVHRCGIVHLRREPSSPLHHVRPIAHPEHLAQLVNELPEPLRIRRRDVEGRHRGVQTYVSNISVFRSCNNELYITVAKRFIHPLTCREHEV